MNTGTVDRPLTPSRMALATITADREELYRHVPPLGEPIPMGDLHLMADDDILEDEDIAWAVRRICLNRSGGTSGIRAEHFLHWMIALIWDDFPDATNWQKVVAIVQETFCELTLVEECTWQTAVLITKGKRYFQDIGLVEVLWKAVARLLNRRLTGEITYHDAIHGFLAVQGTGTAALKAKLLQHLTAMMGAVLFDVFLGIQKAYNALDQERSLELIAAYGVGPRTLKILWKYW